MAKVSVKSEKITPFGGLMASDGQGCQSPSLQRTLL